MGKNKAMIVLGFWLLAAMLIGLAPPAAWAGGLWLYERGTPDVGTANAGVAARAQDASIAASNPAGMARLDKPEVMLTLQPVITDARFQPGAGTTTTATKGTEQKVPDTFGMLTC